MAEATSRVDYRNWDWLPKAAEEMERYLERMLTEGAVSAHDVSARAKSITSFQEKCNRKGYAHPIRDVTDTVAVRIITYSVTDRGRAEELIRNRFQITDGEDRNPGKSRPHEDRGYDCQHFVVTGENSEVDVAWLTMGGKLAQYFDTFGGLEVQIRTVAAHAWAEFEHARRYKGHLYDAISEQDKKTIDQLFGAASDARSALDETFVAIDRVLANPSAIVSPPPEHDDPVDDPADEETVAADKDGVPTPVEPSALRKLLAHRFPDDEEASEKGMEFACDLVKACGLETIQALSRALDTVDGDQVQRLMDTTISVTRVRRLDDQLLARYGENYIKATSDLGNVTTRAQQLEWRYDRLRDKVPTVKHKVYTMAGEDCPENLQGVVLPAARTVRELVRVVAEVKGAEHAYITDAVSQSPDDLPRSARSVELALAKGGSLWVATNLDRQYSERLIDELTQKLSGLDLRVMKHGLEIASSPSGEEST